MARKHNYRRDRLGRFAGAGTKVSASAKGARRAAKTATKTGARKVATGAKNSYVQGSFSRNLVVGQGGDYKGVKAGVELTTPKGRGVLVKGIVGFHGKPDRRLDITPSLDVEQKKLSVKAQPRPLSSRRASAGTKIRR